uniref:Alcohol-forming fatty acyl-CoA reductase n=1 Tax=Simmondsia chinensis TaxID=3999 RepID=FAR_SIMCH|nr:RecName: Full=Alcohol-forming fatty acyl-CoA reductase [Simmondsia chinensis]AAD38039.1 acyl CoA reductase [Simmondsia chinensis]AAD38040.1 acyl CoA reductase [synthetic construct]AFI74369.1 acyl-CoA reductase [synthetic construct]QCQ82563.1 alcohol-forming fatty acyl-CoA reductase [synthetic construct]
MEEMGSILEFLDNKAILVTGATGSLAKIFVEKVLRSQPNVKKLYLLLRATDDETAALRLQNEVFGKELFKVLKQNLGANFYSFVSEKVTVVPGDITGEDLCLKDVNLKEEMWREIDVVVNLAATINFIERYDVSLLINTYGAKYVLDFAKKCNKLKIFVHVSTAYVSGEKNGLILEKPYYMGESLNGRLGLDINVEKKLVEAKINELQAAGATEKSIKSTMKDMGIERARHWGWPNVYVFTKALGEMLLMQYKGDIPLTIIRPTIITSTFKEPFPGWVEGVRTIDNVPVYYGKGRLRCMLCGPSTIIDLIPADMVVNATIVAMVAHANQRYVEPVTYHVGSSAANPMKLSALPEMAHRYFTKNPWINPDRNPVHVGRAMVFSSFSTFHLYLTLNFLLPLKVLEIANTIFCQWFKGKYMDLKRKTRLLLRLVDIYKPYLFFQGIFDDMNTEKLRIAAKESIVEADMFYFDPRAINWEDYFLKTHFPGVVEHVLN